MLRYTLLKIDIGKEGTEMTAIRSKNGPTEKLSLFLLTWPIFLEVFLFMLMGIADTFMLSALSDDAVSGVGAANQYLHIAILVLEVIGNGAAIVVSQYLGSKRFMEASKISALAVTLNLVVGLIISAGFLLFSKHMMTAMNLQGDVLTYAQSYLSIVGGAIFLQAIINSLAAIIRVHGFTKQAMFVSLGMNIIHIAGNYVLIFGKFGFPELGRARGRDFFCCQPVNRTYHFLLATVPRYGIPCEITILLHFIKRICWQNFEDRHSICIRTSHVSSLSNCLLILRNILRYGIVSCKTIRY